MKVATVLDSSLPISMVRKHKGMISVDKRKLITSVSSTCGKSVTSGIFAQRMCINKYVSRKSTRNNVTSYLDQCPNHPKASQP